MKRRARLNFSTDYLPLGNEPEKKVHHEEVQIIGDESLPLRQGNMEKFKDSSIITEDPLKIKEMVMSKSNPESGKNDEISKDIQYDSKVNQSSIIQKNFKTSAIELVKQGVSNQFGNFQDYYEYRCEKKWNDPRINVLKRDWFLNKRVLDIGCNDGQLTLQLSIKYFPLQIIGVDIDYSLINKAVENFLFLEKQHYKTKGKTKPIQQSKEGRSIESQNSSNNIETQEEKKTLIQKLSKIPACFLIKSKEEKIELTSQEPQNLLESQIDKLKEDEIGNQLKDQNKEELNNFQQEKHQIEEQSQMQSTSLMGIMPKIEIKNRFPNNVQFRTENYVENERTTEKYDTIICFSTTKWIHLNFGDEGIKRLFKKVFQSLEVGGFFLLEFQEWKSYKKKLRESEETKDIIKSIKLHPGEFKQYLIDNFKFQLETEISPDVNVEQVPSFFKRTIYVFKKLE